MKKFIALGWTLFIGLPALTVLAAGPADSGNDDYIIGPRDVLNVSVWGESDLQNLCEVSGAGAINFFFLGDVKVAGLTLKEAREKITPLLKDGYIKNPVVIIKVEQFK